MDYDTCFVSETGEHEYDHFLICQCCGFNLYDYERRKELQEA